MEWLQGRHAPVSTANVFASVAQLLTPSISGCDSLGKDEMTGLTSNPKWIKSFGLDRTEGKTFATTEIMTLDSRH